MSANRRAMRHFGILAGCKLLLLGILVATLRPDWWWTIMSVAALGMVWSYLLGLACGESSPPPEPPPHVCPSGLGDCSHEEAYAALLFADAQIDADAAFDAFDASEADGIDPAFAADDLDFELRRRMKIDTEAKWQAAEGVLDERKREYQEIRDRRMSVRK